MSKKKYTLLEFIDDITEYAVVIGLILILICAAF